MTRGRGTTRLSAEIPRDGLANGVDEVLSSLLTCEVVTLARDGTPTAWPMVPLWLPERGTILLTTSIGFPVKAGHLRRDPRIALLFSDPTGSGLTDPPVVLVQGTATVSEQPQTRTPDLAAHWARVHALQPVSRYFSASAPARWFMDWYYVRLVVEVTPERLLVWPDRDPTASPRVHELVTTEPVPAPAPGPEPGSQADLGKRLAGFDDAVVCGRDERGRPVAVRVRPRVDDDGVRWADTPGTGLVPGPASLLCHAHDANLWSLRSFHTLGRLAHDERGWLFRGTRTVDGTGMSGPLGDLATFVSARRRAGRYLRRRSLPRPAVPWADLRGTR